MAPAAHDPQDELVEALAALLAGDRLAAAQILDDLREEFTPRLPPATVESHLSVIHAEAAALAASATPAGASPERAAVIPNLSAHRGRRVAVGIGITAAGLLVTGGLAAAGTLPAPLQDAVSRVAAIVAIDIPPGHPTNPPDDAPGRTGDTPGQSGTTPGATAPGRTGDTPGDTAPGRTGDTPGDTAPGRTGDTPGDTAPGRTVDVPTTDPEEGEGEGDTPGDTAPGRSGTTPGETAPGRDGGDPPGGGKP